MQVIFSKIPWQRFVFFAATSVFLNSQLARAGEYEALCEGQPCQIILTERGFSGPSGFIPANRIVFWSKGGGVEQNENTELAGTVGGSVTGAVLGGVATCWTIVLCPSGIIWGGYAGGGLGSKAGQLIDFSFIVAGYNEEGFKTIQRFNFINKKPVHLITQEFPIFTGLRMGEQRSIKEIRKN